MKRICALLLAFVMMFTMVACGGNNSKKQTDKTQEVITETKVDENLNETETNLYKVIFEYNFGDKGVYKTVEVEKDKTVERPDDPKREGYDFAGWYAENSSTKFDFDTTISTDITLKAKWVKHSRENVTVIPVTNTQSTNSSAKPTPELAKPTPEPAKPTPEPAKPTPKPTTIPEQKVYYTVNFDANGGIVATDYVKVESGECINALPDATMDAHTFLGWYTAPVGGEAITSSSPINGNMTLYAHWQITEIGTGSARITFDRNDGSADVYQVQYVNLGDAVTKPEDPTRELYRFTGWYLESSAVNKYDFGTLVTGDMTLYAGWGNPNGSDDGLYAASNKTETIFSVSDVFVENNEVTVTYNTNNISLVTVEFFEDQMVTGQWSEEALNTNLSIAPVTVASAYTAEYGEMATVTIPITGSLPEHFLVRVTMSDSESNVTEYVSTYYTKTFEEFKALTVDDFDSEKVISFDGSTNTNFGVIKDSVIVLPIMSQYGNGRELQVTEQDKPQNINDNEGQMENLVPDFFYTFPDKNAVISTNDDGTPYTIGDLEVGDVIYVEGTTYMFKIKDIYVNTDGSITFSEDEDVTMQDFYDTLKVDFEGAEADISNDNARWEVIDVNGKGSVALGPFSLEHEFSNGIELSGSVSGKVTGTVVVTYDAKLFAEDYIEVEFKFETEITGEVKAEISTDNHDEYKKAKFQVDTKKVKLPTPVTGLNIYVKPTLQIDWDMSGDVSFEWTSKQTSGFKYDSDNGRTDIKKKENTVSIMAKGKAEAKVGPIIDIGVEVLNGALSGGAIAEAGAKLTAEAEIGADDILNNVDSKHACGLCVTGKAEWYAKAYVKCSYKITDNFQGDIVKLEILNITTPLNLNVAVPGKFFCSVINSADSPYGGLPKFAFGECANKTYRTEFRTQDLNGNDINGKQVTVVRPGQSTGKSGTTPYVVYLYNGTYKTSSNIEGVAVSKSFVVNGDPQTVILNKNSINTTLEGVVVDANNSNTIIANATVKVSQGDVVIASTETNSNGKFNLQVPSGTITVSITQPGYLPFESSETIHEGDATHSMGQIKLTPGVGMGGFRGVIRDAVTNEPIADVKLNLYEGWNNTGNAENLLRTLKTNSNGEFRYETVTLLGNIIGLPSGNYTLIAEKDGYTNTSYNIVVYPGTTNSQPEINETMSAAMNDGNYRIVLTWNSEPRDLDSHLVAETIDGETIHVFYADKNPPPSYVNLDLDDVDGEGPETITITNFEGLKNIRYAVHDYTNHMSSESNAMSRYSDAVVRLYKGNQLLRTFNVPSGYDGTEWTVFSLNTNGRITTINEMSYCDDPAQVLSDVRVYNIQRTYKDYELAEMAAAEVPVTEEVPVSEELISEVPETEEVPVSEELTSEISETEEVPVSEELTSEISETEEVPVSEESTSEIPATAEVIINPKLDDMAA